jgi:hypothetical protein
VKSGRLIGLERNAEDSMGFTVEDLLFDFDEFLFEIGEVVRVPEAG